jgi:phosphinothricin tripeptide acetyl hydrolase
LQSCKKEITLSFREIGEQTMSVKDRARIAEFLAANEREGLDLHGQRARLDALADFFPVPDGVEVEPASVGGIKGEWVRARHARRDAALLYLHGGGYVLGSPKSHRHLAALLSNASDLPVFVAHYRLAPEHPFPAAVDDAVAAYEGLVQSQIVPQKIAIAGDSAGGGLTLATLIALRDKSDTMPACAVVISPWADLSQGGESHRARKQRDPIVGKEGLDEMAKAYLGTANPKEPLASPAYADFQGLPPLLIQVGSEEALHSDAIEVWRKAEAAGVDVSFESWGKMIHVWHIFHVALGEGRDATHRIGSFLKNHLE